MKNTVITCITAIICVVAISVTAVIGTGKICNANVEAAGKAGSNSQGGSAEVADTTASNVVDTETPVDTEVSGETVTDTAGEVVTDAVTDNSSNKTTKPNTSKPVNQFATQAGILNYFNEKVDAVKSGAKSGVKNYEKNTQAGSFTLAGSLKSFSGVINSLVEKNMGEKKEDHNRSLSKADLKKYIPVENESWTSHLSTANIKSATISESNGKYTVTIKVKDDAASANTGHDIGNHGKAFSVVMTQTIIDNAGGVKGLLKDLNIAYRNGTIKATIDKSTGHVTHLNYYYVWVLGVTAAGNVVTAPFGIEQDFTINW